MSIIVKTLNSWSEIQTYAKPGWVYRGQRSAAWDLSTSLERCCEREGIQPNDRHRLEDEFLRDFRRAYHQYSQHVPAKGSIIEWMSLMQHHGAPTRLLDFTYSIYVAAYFALETADSDCAVWAVKAPWVLQESVAALGLAGKAFATKLQAPTREEHETVSNDVLFQPPFARFTILLTPFRLNERLRTQRGTFLAPGDVSTSFMNNLLALPGHEDETHVIKLEIPSTLRKEALQNLFLMNISRTSLFPGLDGYAQSLGIFHPAYVPIDWGDSF